MTEGVRREPRRRSEEFEHRYRDELDQLVRLAYVVSGDRSIAEDVVADVVVRVWARWRRGAVDDLGAYLRRAVVNEVIGRARRTRRDRERAAKLGFERIVTIDTAVDDRQTLWTALCELPPDQRAAIALRYLSDLSEADTAATLGVPVGTVKSRVARGLAQLRTHLSEVAPDA